MITVVSNMTPGSTLIMPSLTLKPVQYVAITFLVDNSIEWLAGLKFTLHPIIEETMHASRMTKLPSGFTHEMRHHLTYKAPQLDPLTGVPILPLEDFCCGPCRNLLVADKSSADRLRIHAHSCTWLLRSDCTYFLIDG